MKKYICHVDFFGLYNLFNDKFTDKNFERIFYEILEELDIETFYLATFNYDFLKLGVTKYGAESQLNEITRVIQKQVNLKHTFDPVFSFCTNDKDYKFKIINDFESFGKESLYDYALKNNMEYLNMGTNLNFISTAIHYAEKFFDIKYRYKKTFNGDYKYKNKNHKIVYRHTVWPKTNDFCNYDAKKINNELINDGVWNVLKMKNGFYLKKARINEFNNYIKEKVRRDPFYPVHIDTKAWMLKHIKENRTISLNNFE